MQQDIYMCVPPTKSFICSNKKLHLVLKHDEGPHRTEIPPCVQADYNNPTISELS